MKTLKKLTKHDFIYNTKGHGTYYTTKTINQSNGMFLQHRTYPSTASSFNKDKSRRQTSKTIRKSSLIMAQQ